MVEKTISFILHIKEMMIKERMISQWQSFNRGGTFVSRFLIQEVSNYLLKHFSMILFLVQNCFDLELSSLSSSFRSDINSLSNSEQTMESLLATVSSSAKQRIYVLHLMCIPTWKFSKFLSKEDLSSTHFRIPVVHKTEELQREALNFFLQVRRQYSICKIQLEEIKKNRCIMQKSLDQFKVRA